MIAHKYLDKPLIKIDQRAQIKTISHLKLMETEAIVYAVFVKNGLKSQKCKSK